MISFSLFIVCSKKNFHRNIAQVLLIFLLTTVEDLTTLQFQQITCYFLLFIGISSDKWRTCIEESITVMLDKFSGYGQVSSRSKQKCFQACLIRKHKLVTLNYFKKQMTARQKQKLEAITQNLKLLNSKVVKAVFEY